MVLLLLARKLFLVMFSACVLLSTCSTVAFAGALEVQGESDARGFTLKEKQTSSGNTSVNRETLMGSWMRRHSYPISSSSSELLEATSFKALALVTLEKDRRC